MEYKNVGRSDIKISVIGFGCWAMGADESDAGWRNIKHEESIAAVHKALDLGINFFDTAEAYGDGKSEEVLGQALKGKRDKVVISSKVFRNHLKKEDVLKACEASLKRLGTDYLDIYYIHWPNPEVPLSETMGAMAKLKEEGKIKVIGVSNFDVDQMEECLKIGRIETSQSPYSLFWRHTEDKVIPFCVRNEVGVFAYSPLAQGLLTGKVTAGQKFDDIRSHNKLFKGKTFEVALQQVERLKKIAQKYGKTPAQVALNWASSQQGIISVIAGAKRPSQLEENLGAVGWELSGEDMSEVGKMGEAVMDTLEDKDPNFFC